MNEIKVSITLAQRNSEYLNSLLVEAACRSTGIDLHGVEQLSPKIPDGLDRWQLRRLRAFMLDRLGTNVSVHEMSDACNLSPGHFGRSFKVTVGHSPHRWNVLIRLELAKDLALRTGMSTHDIGMASGFFDQSHLNRWFHATYKTNFGRWRKLQNQQLDFD